MAPLKRATSHQMHGFASWMGVLPLPTLQRTCRTPPLPPSAGPHPPPFSPARWALSPVPAPRLIHPPQVSMRRQRDATPPSCCVGTSTAVRRSLTSTRRRACTRGQGGTARTVRGSSVRRGGGQGQRAAPRLHTSTASAPTPGPPPTQGPALHPMHLPGAHRGMGATTNPP